jgi:choline dehydrogenase-like flavoprotein
MFIDARTVPENSTLESDICIVGAGAAGITLARDLSQTRLSVLLLESGGLEFASATQDLYEGDVVGHEFTPLSVDRLRYFGGSTNHWSGSCCPFHPVDLQGWPFGRDVLDPFYRQAQAICQLGPFTYEPEAWSTKEARPLALAAGSRILTGVFQCSPPTRFGQVYRADIAATAVQCCLNANVVDIDTNDSGREVTGLRVASLSGNDFRATASSYVLATGGIENPRLLLNANKVQRRGIGNGYDLVGRYFTDHADVIGAGTIAFEGDSAAGRFYVEGSDKMPGLTAQGYLFLAPDVREREGLPSACIALQKGLPAGYFLVQSSLRSMYHDLKSGHLPEHLAFDVKQIIGRAEEKIARAYDRLFRSPSSFYSTIYSCGPAPDRDSRVKLIDAVDALGMRRVAVDWRLPSDFAHGARRLHEILGEELGRAGLGRLRVDLNDPGRDPAKEAVNGHHHMGTTRMHRDPRQGVVDENCRVHGISNLFIAGSSVFPTYGFDNPTMTIVALALRLSAHLKTVMA